MNRYPHVDGSRRGLADGYCIHCGASGSLEDEECPVRLRERVDKLERALQALGAYAWTCGQEAPPRDPMLRELVYNVASDAHRLGLIERGP